MTDTAPTTFAPDALVTSTRQSVDRPLIAPELRQLRDYWLAKRRDRAMPARREIDPVDIPQLLPFLALTEVHWEPLRFRYRLIGTAVTESAGRDSTGKWMSRDLYGDFMEEMLWPYQTCVESSEPLAFRRLAKFVLKEWMLVETLMLPLGDTDNCVNMILSGVVDLGGTIDAPPENTVHILDWRAD